MWKLTKTENITESQDLKFKSLLIIMAKSSNATYSGEFENHFQEFMKGMSKNFTDKLLYEVTPRNRESVEVWKIDEFGEFNYKMFTLDYIEEIQPTLVQPVKQTQLNL